MPAVYFICCFLCLALGLFAQSPSPSVDSTSLGRINKGLADSTPWLWRWQGQEQWQHLDTNFNGFTQARQLLQAQDWGLQPLWADLGNLGSPLFSRVQTIETLRPLGHRLAPSPYQAYRLGSHNLREFKVIGDRPLTDIQYGQITQRNTNIRINFSHQIKPKLYYAVFYDLINYFGFYAEQQVRNQNLGLHLRFSNSSGRYRAQVGAFSHQVKQSEHGGSRNDTLIGGLNNDLLPTRTPIWLSREAQTNRGQVEVFYHQDFLPDSNSQTFWRHSFEYETWEHRFFDKDPSFAGGLYYQTWAINPRGLRFRLGQTELRNRLARINQDSLQTWSLALEHLWTIWEQEPLANRSFQSLALEGRYRQALFSAQARGQWSQGLGLGAEALGRWQLWQNQSSAALLEGLFLHRPIGLGEQAVYANRALLQANDFKPETQGQLAARLNWGKTGGLRLAYQHWQQYVYLYQDYRLYQYDRGLNLFQASLQQGLAWRKWHVDLQVTGQYLPSGNAVLPLPRWIVMADFYWEGKAFKHLFLRLGTSFNTWEPYATQGYFPALGRFFVQDTRILPSVPAWDFYLAARLWKARFFLRAEHLVQLISGENYFAAWRYPLPNFFLRMGLSWRLLD